MLNHPNKVWLFDVDGTLIGSIRSNRLRPGVMELIELLQACRTTLVVWSAGGGDYAERMMGQFELAHRFDAYYDKGLRGPDGRYLIDHLRPEHRPGTLVDDYPDEVPLAPRVIGVRQFLGSNPQDAGLQDAIRIARGVLDGGSGKWLK